MIAHLETAHSFGERHRRVLFYLDAIFGAYCVAIAAAAFVAWHNGHGSLRTVGVLIAFLLVNGIISQMSRRTTRPLAAEIGARPPGPRLRRWPTSRPMRRSGCGGPAS